MSATATDLSAISARFISQFKTLDVLIAPNTRIQIAGKSYKVTTGSDGAPNSIVEESSKIVASIKLFMGLTRDVTPNNLSAQEQSLIDSNPQSFIDNLLTQIVKKHKEQRAAQQLEKLMTEHTFRNTFYQLCKKNSCFLRLVLNLTQQDVLKYHQLESLLAASAIKRYEACVEILTSETKRMVNPFIFAVKKHIEQIEDDLEKCYFKKLSKLLDDKVSDYQPPEQIDFNIAKCKQPLSVLFSLRFKQFKYICSNLSFTLILARLHIEKCLTWEDIDNITSKKTPNDITTQFWLALSQRQSSASSAQAFTQHFVSVLKQITQNEAVCCGIDDKVVLTFIGRICSQFEDTFGLELSGISQAENYTTSAPSRWICNAFVEFRKLIIDGNEPDQLFNLFLAQCAVVKVLTKQEYLELKHQGYKESITRQIFELMRTFKRKSGITATATDLIALAIDRTFHSSVATEQHKAILELLRHKLDSTKAGDIHFNSKAGEDFKGSKKSEFDLLMLSYEPLSKIFEERKLFDVVCDSMKKHSKSHRVMEQWMQERTVDIRKTKFIEIISSHEIYFSQFTQALTDITENAQSFDLSDDDKLYFVDLKQSLSHSH